MDNSNRSTFDKWHIIDELKLKMTDEELLTLIKDRKTISEPLAKKINTGGKVNKNYYVWIDPTTKNIMNKKSKVIDNRIFTDLETIVPMVTSKPAKPVVFIPIIQWEKNDKAIREQAIKTQKILLGIFREQWLQQQFEKLIRHHQIYKIGIIKYWIKDGKIFAMVVLPTRLLLDSEATSIEDSEFIWEKVVTTAKKLSERFPKKASDISKKVNWKLGTKVTYIEWRTNDFTVLEFKGIILEKKKNPLFDYDWVTETKVDEFGKEMKKTTKHNYFNTPRIPYISLNIYNLGESILDDVTALELCKSLQDDINQRKRQIADNADRVWNPIRTATGFRKEQVWEINDNIEAWDAIMVSEDQSIWYVSAQPLPAHVLNSLEDSRNSIDNIFWIHSTTRWERTAQETATGREILRSWDEDRQATIWRAIETLSEELYAAFAHLVKVFYDTPQLLPILWEDNTEEYLEFKREDLAEWMKVIVRPWSTIPDDPIARKSQALQLAQLWKISNRKLLEELWVEDPDEVVNELELEEVRAQMKQEKEAQKERDKLNTKKEAEWFEETINQLGWQNSPIQ